MNKYTSHIDPAQEEEILRKYVAGEANNEEAHWLENRALSDPFLAEAMDGYEMNPDSINKVDHLRKRIDRKTATNGAWWIVPGILIVTTVIIWMMMGSQPDSLPEKQKLVQQKPVEQSKKEAEEPVVVDHKITDSSMTFTVKAPVASNSKNEPVQEKIEEEYVRKLPAPEPLQKEVPITVDRPASSTDDREPMLSGAPIYHVLDYKMVDYRGLRITNSWETSFTPEIGTPASMQTKDDKTTISFNDTKKVAYVTYLEETMELFALARYKKAMNRFKTILEHFPEDANGLFYGGMCARELNRHETSVSYLKASAALTISTFKAESEFYLAKELLEIQEDAEACELLQRIKREQGFYAQRAAEISNLYCED